MTFMLNGKPQCGPLDVVCILHDVTTGRYHAALFDERPFPGPVSPVEKTDVVRLMSRSHHTTGAATLEEALVHLKDLAVHVNAEPENIWTEPREWGGEIGIVWVVPNWRK
jgi:hypothetical protein